jgi:hypothetical protein
MKAIETDITVSTDGRASLDFALPAGVPPGIHRAFVVIEEQLTERMSSRGHLKFSTHPVGPVPVDSTYRREDIYGDDGR